MPSPTTDSPHRSRRALVRRSRQLTRLLAAGTAVLVLVQGALAGSHLAGDTAALGFHRMLGTEVLTMLGLAVVVTSAGTVRTHPWALPASIAGLLALGAQIGMGFSDQLGIHVPLGIGLFGLYLTLALTLTTKETTT